MHSIRQFASFVRAALHSIGHERSGPVMTQPSGAAQPCSQAPMYWRSRWSTPQARALSARWFKYDWHASPSHPAIVVPMTPNSPSSASASLAFLMMVSAIHGNAGLVASPYAPRRLLHFETGLLYLPDYPVMWGGPTVMQCGD